MVNFEDTKVAFTGSTNSELKKAHFVFQVLGIPWLNKLGTQLTVLALNLRLPVKGLIKWTVFDHFCGGETIKGCKPRIQRLYDKRIHTILDYSVEGEQDEAAFDNCLSQLLEGLELAENENAIPFCVVKLSGLMPFSILEKLNLGVPLDSDENEALKRGKNRVHQIASAAKRSDTPFMIDAEESWIQDTIDVIVEELMWEFNREKVLIYNTVQMYRHDRLAYIKQLHAKAKSQGIFIGLKIVRGAYMEKERARADQMGYPSPIQIDKAATDQDYDDALRYCSKNSKEIAICCGTHNEESSLLLTELMKEERQSSNEQHYYFAQLLGMSDHISYNLSKAGYNVAKYVPYGPVKEVMPYLIRRAEENTSVAGQTNRELGLIKAEIKRRNS